MKIAELIQDEQIQIAAECGIDITPQTSVSDVLRKMEVQGFQSIAITREGSDEPILISREDLLHALLIELDITHDKFEKLQKQVETTMADQIDMVHETVNSIAAWEKGKLEHAIDNMTEGLIILGKNREIEKANPSAKRLLGLKKDDSLEALAAVIDGLGFREIVCKQDDTDERKRGEFKVRSATGRILKMRWNEMLDQWKHFLGNIVTIRDVTEEEASEKTKTEFIAAISHELRTPLTSIQNSVSNILAGVTGKITKKTSEYLHVMKSDCHRFADLINDLLDVAKIEAGNMPVSRKVMNIVSTAQDTVSQFTDTAKDHDIDLTCRIDSHIPPVYADPKRIQQVMWNLVNNAITFTQPGGKVSVKIYDDGQRIVTVVHDTGVGIAPQLQKQIFSKFYQIRRQAGAGSKGSGLGLAICNGIIAVHGGSIWVESTQGKGSKFYFSLPKSDPFVILYKHIHSLSESSIERSQQISMIIVNFDVPHERTDNLKPTVRAIINELLEQSDNFLKEKNSIAIQTEDFEIAFVLDEKNSRHIGPIKSNIKKIIEDRLRKNCGHPHILPMVGIAVYPQDATEAKGLEKAARSRITKMF